MGWDNRTHKHDYQWVGSADGYLAVLIMDNQGTSRVCGWQLCTCGLWRWTPHPRPSEARLLNPGRGRIS